MSYFTRHITPDAEGYLYYVKTPSGYLYGPYSTRANAANGAAQRRPYVPRTIWTRDAGYQPNPAYLEPRQEWEIVKAKLGTFEKAPKLSMKDKYEAALQRIAELEDKLNEL